MTLPELRGPLSVREVARRMGMTHVNVLQIERGRDTPLSTLRAYASAVGADITAVVNAHEQSAKENEKIPVCNFQ